MGQNKLVNKAQKFIFPKTDVKIPNYCERNFSRIECLSHMMNLSIGKLDMRTYDFWSNLCKRDIRIKEYDKAGIPATKYDIRKQMALFKKEREKEDYVKKLIKANKEPSIQLDSCATVCNPKYSRCELLSTFYSNNKQFLSILENLFVNCKRKKCKNKLLKFKNMIQYGNMKSSKLSYYIKLMSRLLYLTGKDKSMKVLKINLDNRENIPFIFGLVNSNVKQSGGEWNLSQLLCDTGSEVNLISISTLRHCNINLSTIQPSKHFSISSSTNLVEDCILGQIKLKMFFMRNNNNNELVKGTVNFLIASEKISLDKIILGFPFLNDHQVNLSFPGGFSGNPRVSGIFSTEQGHKRVNLKVNDSNLICQNADEIKKGADKLTLTSNKILIGTQKFTISHKHGNFLKLPQIVTLVAQTKMSFRNNGWPFLQNASVFSLPCKLDENIKRVSITLCPAVSESVLSENSLQTMSANSSSDERVNKCQAQGLQKHSWKDAKGHLNDTLHNCHMSSRENQGRLKHFWRSDKGQMEDIFEHWATASHLMSNITVKSTNIESRGKVPILAQNNADEEDESEKILNPAPTSPSKKIKNNKSCKIQTVESICCNECDSEKCQCYNICYQDCHQVFGSCKCYDDICKICQENINTCICILTCNSCGKSVSTKIKKDQNWCSCGAESLNVLRTKVDHFDVSSEEQLSVSNIIDKKMEQFNLEPEEPGSKLDLEHLDPTCVKQIKSLISCYPKAFASHKLDAGSYNGFTARLEVKEGTSARERPRPMKAHVATEISPIMTDLIKNDIICKADVHGDFSSNLNCVSKPIKDRIPLLGKADAHIGRMTGVKSNHQRICVDMRSLNSCLLPEPKISLPSYKDLASRFKNTIVSTLDMSSMYWSIHISKKSQPYTNFWYNGQLYSFKRLVMGLKTACYIGQQAMLLAFSDINLKEFLSLKNIKLKSAEFPFSSISEAILIYLDDVALFTPKSVSNPKTLHLLLIEFIFYATSKLGFKLSMSKLSLMNPVFKFLGHQFDSNKNETCIPEGKINAYAQMRSPRSCAETISRISSLGYFSTYLPLLRTISLPLQQMSQSGVFQWNEIHELSWQCLKLLASLKFENRVPDNSQPLFISADASQIAIGILAFQIDPDGEISLVYCDSKLLSSGDRNKPASHRELLAMVFSLISLENTIKAHQSPVIMLSDCISLQLVARGKFSDNKMLEISLYLSTFENLSIRYFSGAHLFFCDLLSRSFNEVYIKNDRNLSKEWSQILPPVKGTDGVNIRPALITDYVLANPSEELIDCFAKSDFYSQSKTRYFNLTMQDALSQNVPKELGFMASLWAGWNSEKLTREQFDMASRKIKDFPSGALARRLSNPNLGMLRKTLVDLKLDERLLKILEKKYNLNSVPKRNSTVQEEMKFLDIPNEIQQKVESCLRTQGKKLNTKIVNPTILENCKVDFDVERSNILQQANILDLSEDELCRVFNTDKSVIYRKLKNLWPHLGAIFEFLEPNNDLFLYPKIEFFDETNFDFRKALKFLILIQNNLSNNTFFTPIGLIKIPYVFKSDLLNIEFDDKNFTFILKETMTISNFTTCQVEFKLKIYITQLITFFSDENNKFQCDIHSQPPGFQHYNILYCHNFTNQTLVLPAGSVLGKLCINTFNKSTSFLPVIVNEKEFDEMSCTTQQWDLFNIRTKMCDNITQMLQFSDKNMEKVGENLKFENKQGKQIYITSLIRRANIDPAKLPRKKSGAIDFKCQKMLSALNTLLLSQHLMKSKLTINHESLIIIQKSEPKFSTIFEKLQTDVHQTNDYALIEGILYKIRTVYGQKAIRLCIPSFVGNQVLSNLHHNNSAHPSIDNLLNQFSSVFYTPDAAKMARHIIQNCCVCQLNKKHYKPTTSGKNRGNEDNLEPGAIWQIDCIFMPKSKFGFKYILILIDRLTSYVVCIPLRALTVQTTTSALRFFLAIFPWPNSIGSDFGSEFGRGFTKFLAEYGINHINNIPQRSESQGSSEVHIRIFRNMIAKLAANTDEKKSDWASLLPRLVATINEFHPHRARLSRTQLLFSPFIHCSPQLGIENPIMAQHKAFKILNNKRIKDLLKKSPSQAVDKINEFSVGNYVLFRTQHKTDPPPRQTDIFKILKIDKQNFAITVQNIRSLSQTTTTHNKIQKIKLEDLTNPTFSIDDLWNRMADLNIERRNIYQPARTHRQLHLLTSPPDDAASEEQIDPVHHDEVLGHEPVGEDEAHHQDRGQFQDQGEPTVPSSKIKEQLQLQQLDESRHPMEGSDEAPESEAQDYQQAPWGREQNPEERRYNLRPRKIHSTQLVCPNKSIIKETKYNLSNNNLDTLFSCCPDKDLFIARKKALLLHNLICEVVNCNLCSMFIKTRHNQFLSNNMQSYVSGEFDLSDIKIKPTEKRVRFSKLAKTEGKCKTFKVNLLHIHLATYFCTSLNELGCLN